MTDDVRAAADRLRRWNVWRRDHPNSLRAPAGDNPYPGADGGRQELADRATLAEAWLAEHLPPNPKNEELAAKFRAILRDGDGKPDGTAEGLASCARMLDTYGPDLYPANEIGQIHFARAMMESTADEIRAYLTERTWRDIASAPKDSSWILGLMRTRRQAVVRWGGGAWEDDNRLFRDSTHWQPLPLPLTQETP